MFKFTSILPLAVVPSALLLPITPASADPTKATFYLETPSVCSSLGGVTLYQAANTPFGAYRVQGTQVILVLREVTVTQTVTATGEVTFQEVTFQKNGSVPVDEECSFSFEEDGFTTTVTGGFLLGGPSAP